MYCVFHFYLLLYLRCELSSSCVDIRTFLMLPSFLCWMKLSVVIIDKLLFELTYLMRDFWITFFFLNSAGCLGLGKDTYVLQRGVNDVIAVEFLPVMKFWGDSFNWSGSVNICVLIFSNSPWGFLLILFYDVRWGFCLVTISSVNS